MLTNTYITYYVYCLLFIVFLFSVIDFLKEKTNTNIASMQNKRHYVKNSKESIDFIISIAIGKGYLVKGI